MLFEGAIDTANIRNLRLYFASDNSLRFSHRIATLLWPRSSHNAQIHVFVPDELGERGDEAIRIEATPDRRARISVTTQAEKLFSDCYGEFSDQEPRRRHP